MKIIEQLSVSSIMEVMGQIITKDTSIAISNRDQFIYYHLSFEDVIFLEAQNRRTKVESFQHQGGHKLNLSELEYTLPEQFIRCHRSYIINLNYIVKIHPDSHSTFMLVLENGVVSQLVKRMQVSFVIY